MGTTIKLSTADSCSKIGTSDKHSVSDLGNKIDGPKQSILEYSISKDKVFCFTCRNILSGLGNSEDVFTKYGYFDWKNIKRSLQFVAIFANYTYWFCKI